jgi:hypothetical protein
VQRLLPVWPLLVFPYQTLQDCYCLLLEP